MDAAQHSVEFAEVKLTEHKQEVLNESNESHKVEIVLPTGIVVRLGRLHVELSVIRHFSPGETLMFNVSPAVKIFVCTKPVDMRRSFGTPG